MKTLPASSGRCDDIDPVPGCLDEGSNEIKKNTGSLTSANHTQSESYIITVSAAARLIPNPPALVERRKTKYDESDENNQAHFLV